MGWLQGLVKTSCVGVVRTGPRVDAKGVRALEGTGRTVGSDRTVSKSMGWGSTRFERSVPGNQRCQQQIWQRKGILLGEHFSLVNLAGIKLISIGKVWALKFYTPPCLFQISWDNFLTDPQMSVDNSQSSSDSKTAVPPFFVRYSFCLGFLD